VDRYNPIFSNDSSKTTFKIDAVTEINPVASVNTGINLEAQRKILSEYNLTKHAKEILEIFKLT
jgi:hypothetical protein